MHTNSVLSLLGDNSIQVSSVSGCLWPDAALGVGKCFQVWLCVQQTVSEDKDRFSLWSEETGELTAYYKRFGFPKFRALSPVAQPFASMVVAQPSWQPPVRTGTCKIIILATALVDNKLSSLSDPGVLGLWCISGSRAG